jgi:hypothetical protein
VLGKIFEKKVEQATGFRSALTKVVKGTAELGKGIVEIGKSLAQGVNAAKKLIGFFTGSPS